ncbi:hypothetical protein D3C77_336650 [compost metagenome]
MLVGGLDSQDGHGALAFVDGRLQAHGVLELGLGRQWAIHHGVLLAMQAFGERHVQPFELRLAGLGRPQEHFGGRQHGHGRQHTELVAEELVDVLQFVAVQRVLGGADGQCIERGVVLVVFGFQEGHRFARHFHVNEGVATLGRRLHAYKQLLEAVGTVGVVCAVLIELGDA